MDEQRREFWRLARAYLDPDSATTCADLAAFMWEEVPEFSRWDFGDILDRVVRVYHRVNLDRIPF